MSEKYVPKKGDRVRVVLEGEAQPYPDGFYIGPHRENFILPRQAHVVSVEKITPPLPTTPGSVIQTNWGGSGPHFRYALADTGWQALYGVSEAFPSEDFAGRDYEVLFDAGKDA